MGTLIGTNDARSSPSVRVYTATGIIQYTYMGLPLHQGVGCLKVKLDNFEAATAYQGTMI
jgi:hypothetical protein